MARAPSSGRCAGGDPPAGATPRVAGARRRSGPVSDRVLILGGTHEAAELARALAAEPGVETISSLAGRTRRPAEITGAVRRGGFGGAGGLAAWLRAQDIDLVVDATHPYAETISVHAAAACQGTAVPRLVLHRPPWTPEPGDDWIAAADSEGAARVLPGLGERVLLTIGSRGLAPFLRVPGIRLVVRAIETPEISLDGSRVTLLRARGPFDLDRERRLLASQAIDVLVSRNSGGSAAHAKLRAARALGLPVVMIARPPPPPGERVDSVAAALAWVERQRRAR